MKMSCIFFLTLLTISLMLTTTPTGHAYKQTVDVLLSNGHKVTVLFADNFPDSVLQVNIAYMQQDIPKIAELFYMPDHNFTVTYNTEPSPNGCPPSGSTASYREICIRTDLLTVENAAPEPAIVHELTHVFQFEISQYPGQLQGTDRCCSLQNDPAIYADSIAFNYYLPSNGFEKLYAYKPSFLRDYNAQIGSGQDLSS